MALREDPAVAGAHGRHLRPDASSVRRRPVLDDDRWFVSQLPALAEEVEAEVDLLGRVEERGVVAADDVQCLLAHGVTGADEVRAGSRFVHVSRSTSEGELRRLDDTAHARDLEGDGTKAIVGGEQLEQARDRVRQEDGVVVEENEYFRAGSFGQVVAACRYARVLVEADPSDAGARRQRRIGSHVEDDDLGESVACRGQRLIQFCRSIVADDAQRYGLHTLTMSHRPRPPRAFLVSRWSVPHVGGVERQMLLIGGALMEEGVEVDYWTTTPGATVPSGATLHQRRLGSSLIPYLAWLAVSLAVARIRALRARPVVVVARVSAESFLLSGLSRVLRVPLVVFLTGGDEHGSEFVAQRRPLVRRALLRATDCFVAHASVFLDEVRAAGYTGRCERIPTIVEERGPMACETQLTTGRDVVVWCGRAEPVKNLPFMIRLVDEGLLAPRNLIVITNTPVVVPEGVEVHLDCPSPMAHFGDVGVIALPSLIEGQSNVLAEAALAGTPTVAFSTGGSPEIVRELDGGEAVQPDDLRAFAATLERVAARFSDQREREALSARAQHLFGRGAPRSWAALVGELTS